jgi:dethiobiotin synthetase
MKNIFPKFQIQNPGRGRAWFISGTGTGVGKTYTTAFIANSLIEKGFSVAVMKTVQTGLADVKPDLAAIERLCPRIIKPQGKTFSPYSFKLAASPHLAAKCENRKIRAVNILKSFAKIREENPEAIILVEGAGGLFVPISEKIMMIDIIKKMGLPVVLTALSGLGTINHTLLSVEALKKRKIKIEGIALNLFPRNPDIIADDNFKTIKRLSKIQNIGIVPAGKTENGKNGEGKIIATMTKV